MCIHLSKSKANRRRFMQACVLTRDFGTRNTQYEIRENFTSNKRHLALLDIYARVFECMLEVYFVPGLTIFLLLLEQRNRLSCTNLYSWGTYYVFGKHFVMDEPNTNIYGERAIDSAVCIGIGNVPCTLVPPLQYQVIVPLILLSWIKKHRRSVCMKDP